MVYSDGQAQITRQETEIMGATEQDANDENRHAVPHQSSSIGSTREVLPSTKHPEAAEQRVLCLSRRSEPLASVLPTDHLRSLPEPSTGTSSEEMSQDSLFFSAQRNGITAQATGRYAQALHFYRLALKIKRDVVKRSPKVVQEAYTDILYSIGIIQLSSDPEKSLEAFHICLDLRRRFYGPTHPSVTVVLFKLASLYANAGDHQYALCLLLEIHAIVVTTPGDREMLCTVWNAIGEAQQCLGRFDEARSSFQAAAHIANGCEFRAQ